MASSNSLDIATYLLADWPSDCRHALLLPATRWRVLFEEVEEIETDIILNTVLRVHQAGERDPTRIADLLQLPEDLIRYLISTAKQLGISARSISSTVINSSRVGWMYRDQLSGELWPEPANEVVPMGLRFSSRSRGRFEVGSFGRPIHVDALLVELEPKTMPIPTSTELAKFSRTSEAQRRVNVISSADLCIVAVPVTRDHSGFSVITSRNSPHISLSRFVNSNLESNSDLRKWANGIPSGKATEQEIPLAMATVELSHLVLEIRKSQASSSLFSDLSDQIELTISRWVDQFLLGNSEHGNKTIKGIKIPHNDVSDFTGSLDLPSEWKILSKSDARNKVWFLNEQQEMEKGSIASQLISICIAYDRVLNLSLSRQNLLEISDRLINISNILLTLDKEKYDQKI